ncbi:hypothetical protein [Taibaiella soli]|nr:hypothetical protein [Taibaiella soli]
MLRIVILSALLISALNCCGQKFTIDNETEFDLYYGMGATQEGTGCSGHGISPHKSVMVFTNIDSVNWDCRYFKTPIKPKTYQGFVVAMQNGGRGVDPTRFRDCLAYIIKYGVKIHYYWLVDNKGDITIRIIEQGW